MKVIIEHLDNEIFDWSYIEYRHISSFVGKKNLIFTNLERTEDGQNKRIKGYEKLNDLGELKDKNIKELKSEIEKKYGKICLLDPKAKKLLTPKDKKEFGVFLFGGILGDNPPRGRTEKAFGDLFDTNSKRNLGNIQMATNTAVLVTQKIIDEEIAFEKLDFVDEIEIILDEDADEKQNTENKPRTYSQILPYRYLVIDGKPILPNGLIEYLKEMDE